MNERLKLLRKTLHLTQQELADKLKISRNNIASYETRKSNLSDSVIALICREFNVSEDWLRTGNGDMFDDTSREEMAARIVGKALNTNDEFILNTFIALGQLSETEWNVVKKFVDAIKSGNKDFKYNDSDN